MAQRPGPVLVTGANSGIGLATTLLLAKRGWTTWGTVRSKAKATALHDAAEAAGVASNVTPVVLDVGDDKAVVARWPELPAFYAVVNNAGYSELGAVEEVSAKDARAQLDVNVVAPAVVSAIESRRPLRRYLVGVDAVSVASTHPLIPRALTDAATRLVSGLGGGPTTYG